MPGQEFAIVHAVEMIAGKYEQRIDTPVANVREPLTYSVGGSLKPLWAFRRLFGSHYFDKAVGKLRKAIGLRQMTVERSRVVLREHKHLEDIRVDAIRNSDIDEPVFAAYRYGGLGPFLREWKQTLSCTTTENHRE